MYRLLTILISFLFTAHAMRASVAIPYVFVKNYTVDDYKASCQNWGFSLTPDGMLYVANNSACLLSTATHGNYIRCRDRKR